MESLENKAGKNETAGILSEGHAKKKPIRRDDMGKHCCKKFKEAVRRCDIFNKVQYGTKGTKYDWGYYTDYGEKVWECPFCGKKMDQ